MTDATAVRTYKEEDFEALAALVDAIAAPERVSTRSGLRSFLSAPGYRPQTDLFVATPFTADGLLGARDVRIAARGDEEAPILESWGGIDPSAPSPAVTGALLRAVFARAGRLIAERGRNRGIVQVRCGADDAASRAAFEAFGLEYARDLVTMLRRSLNDIEAPTFPAGVELRAYRIGEDDAVWVRAFNEAFAGHWGGFMEMPTALWQHYLYDPTFKPEISLVAWDGAALAGFCHCRIDDELNALTGRRVGMIRYLGVLPAWRRIGLGGALTLAGLRTLREAGMDAVALGVDVENVTGARRLYERYGFEVVGRQVMYRRSVFATD